MSYASSLGASFGKQAAKAVKPKKVKPATLGAQAGALAAAPGYGAQAGQAAAAYGNGPSLGMAAGGQAATAGLAAQPTVVGDAPNALGSSAATLGGDSGLLSAEDQAKRATSLADAQYQYATNAAGLDYGYNAQGGIDTNNPYGRAALLQHMATNQHRGNTNSYAAAGLGYSGALQNAQDETERQYQIGQDQNYKGYQGALQAALGTKVNTYANQTGGVSDADFAALLRALGGSS